MKPLIKKVNTLEFTRIFSFTFFVKVEKRTEREVEINKINLIICLLRIWLLLTPLGILMAVLVLEFSREGYKIRKVLG